MGIRGFGFKPLGSLLRQVLELEGAMGIAYERSHGFLKDDHDHDRVILVAPRGASAMEVRVPSVRKTYRIDSEHVLIVPPLLVHSDHHVTEIYDTFALLPSCELLSELGLRWDAPRLLRRSPELKELLEDYFYRRILRRESGAGLRPKEVRLLKEIDRIERGLPPEAGGRECFQPTPSEPTDEVVARALRHFEANLFSEIDLQGLAETLGVSDSTVIRRFRDVMNESPIGYLRRRRLDEARALLGDGIYSVSEVAILVGYSNPGAFSEAYKREFGCNPSDDGK